MRRTLLGVNVLLAVVIVGLFVAGVVFAQGPSATPDGKMPPGGGARPISLAAYKAIATLLGTTPGGLLDEQLAGKTLLDIANEKSVTEQQLTDAIAAAREESSNEGGPQGGPGGGGPGGQSGTPGPGGGGPGAPSGTPPSGTPGPGGGGPGGPQDSGSDASSVLSSTSTDGVPGGSAVARALATLLSMTPGQLLDEVVGGKSLTEIGTEKGVTEQQLADTILAALKDSPMVDKLKEMSAADLIKQFGSLTGGPGGGPGGPGGGKGGPGGPPPDSTATPTS